MISMLRKGACSGSIHDLVHIPAQNFLADCLPKASANAAHPIYLVSDADSDDSADKDGEKHSQSEHHRGFHRRGR